LNVEVFIDCLIRPVAVAKQNVLLIVDKLRVHHAEAVVERQRRRRPDIEIVSLPADAPEPKPTLCGLSGSNRRTNISTPI
jgi:hypothetical protein